jgi:ketosteroid isomerase-like protein
MITRRMLAAGLGSVAVGLPLVAAAQADEVAAVKAAVEVLRTAMLAADKAKLESITADQLSYGHSSGKLESKSVFIDVIASKKTTYKMIEFSDVAVTVVGTSAIVRHNWDGISVADGKESTSKISVLQAWVKVDGAWKLLGRQAYKV